VCGKTVIVISEGEDEGTPRLALSGVSSGITIMACCSRVLEKEKFWKECVDNEAK
jgi:hypothetical protein